jgi:hypothetical protein
MIGHIFVHFYIVHKLLVLNIIHPCIHIFFAKMNMFRWFYKLEYNLELMLHKHNLLDKYHICLEWYCILFYIDILKLMDCKFHKLHKLKCKILWRLDNCNQPDIYHKLIQFYCNLENIRKYCLNECNLHWLHIWVCIF